MTQAYRRQSGHIFTPTAVKPLVVFTESDLTYFCTGDTITDADGNKFTLSEAKHLTARLWRVILIPQEAHQ